MREIRIIAAGVCTLLFFSCSNPVPPQEKLCANDDAINGIIATMSLEEKVEMLHSKTIMSSEGIPRLGIQEIRYADGPFGIREEVGDHFRPLDWKTDSATYFPTGSALAATWSKEMAYKYGTGMGREARLRGKDVILGPAINIQRLPVGGRSYEYLSEDPVLSAVLATAYTKGTQDAGTAVCLKHYAVNNQELNRGTVDARVDERTLREIYLKPFEAAVREGGAMSVMTAYNKVNGYYCSENAHLNNEILRGEWGFRGLTVSDWGGTHSTMGAAFGGLDVQMTGDNYLGPALIDSVKNGAVPESLIDDKVREILRVRFAVEAIPEDQCNLSTTSLPEQQRIAYEVATKSIVLLKNDNGLLPVRSGKVAVIGPNATLKTARGGVGAGVKTPYEITVLDGLRNSGLDIIYSPDDASIAKDADAVVFVCGTDREFESESRDRKDIFLPEGQEALLESIAAVNGNIVTVVLSGGPCDLRKVNELSPAVVQGWWNGMEGGNALADVLTGKIAPSGKLPFTFPLKLEDSPAFATGSYPQHAPVATDLFSSLFRKDRKEGQGVSGLFEPWKPVAEYAEGQYVGYRWYDTRKVPVLYAFGHGLSYVSFEYSDVSVKDKVYGPDDVVKVSLKVRNTGSMDAEEVVQLYVSRTDAQVEWPVKELKGFDRVALKAGQTQKLTLELPVSELRYWDVQDSAWKLEDGTIKILVGSSSDDIRLQTAISVKN